MEAKTTVLVLPEDLEKLRKLQAAILLQREVLESLLHEQERVVQDHYDIDLNKESWELDLELGILSKVE